MHWVSRRIRNMRWKNDLFTQPLMAKENPLRTFWHDSRILITFNKINAMDNVQFRLNDKGRGHFFIAEGDKEIAVMEIGITEAGITVYHTEVVPEAEGRGLGRQL